MLENVNLLRRRALAVARLAASMIIDAHDTEPETCEALRFGHLVTRRPSGFFKIRRGQELTIDPAMLDHFFRVYSPYIPGPHHLVEPERALTALHNKKVAKLAAQSPTPQGGDAPQILDLARQPNGGFA